MRVAALFSGGKDSACAARAARLAGHELACVVTLEPESAESRLLHYPNARWTALQAESMGVPRVAARAPAGAPEVRGLAALLAEARERHGAEGAVHGGIRSRFQRDGFGRACGLAGIEAISPLWGADPGRHMRALLGAGFEFVITAVSAGGLDGSWLGRTVTRGALAELEGLAARHGFGVDFEGGEAETFVTDCPLFSRPVRITESEPSWDSYRGELEILGAELV